MQRLPDFTQRSNALMARLLCGELYCLEPDHCMAIVDATYANDEYQSKLRSPNEQTWGAI
jgi:hypothetical protein